MLKQKPQLREPVGSTRRSISGRVLLAVSTGVFLYTRRRGPGLRVSGLVGFGVMVAFVALGYGLFHPLAANASPANTINFQARLETASGAIATDGTYNVEFKLYSASSGGTALWTEDYLVNASQGIRTANGYLTANLGSVTPFPSSINFGQQLYLTMNIGGTGTTASYDGEMSPRLSLTSVPSAFALNSYNSANGYTGSLTVAQPTSGNQVFVVPDQGAAGTYSLMTTTSGIQNQNVSAQSAANFWISGTGKAASGFAAPSLDTLASGTLSIGTSTASAITLGKSGITTTVAGLLTSSGLLTASAGLTVSGGSTFTNASSTLLTPISVSITGGSIGSAATTVDIASAINVTVTASGQTVTIPSPTNTAPGRILYIANVGSNAFNIGSTSLSSHTATSLLWDGTTWTSASTFGSSNAYINNNSTSIQGSASFNIDGSGQVGTTFTAGGLVTANAGLTVKATNNYTIAGAALTLQDTTGTNTLALRTTAAADNNLFIGLNTAININNTGSSTNNIAIGRYSQASLTTGSSNTSTGLNSLNNNSTGNNNTAFGFGAAQGSGCTAGSNCDLTGVTAVGYAAGYSLQSGANNSSLFGVNAGRYLTTGSGNTAFGNSALSGTASSGLTANTGANNAAFGNNALTAIQSGNQNVAFGNSVLQALTTGGQNTAIGNQAGSNLVSGVNNNFLGNTAGYSSVDGSRNTVQGNQALYFNVSGNNNVANGFQASYGGTQQSNNLGACDTSNGGVGCSLYNTTTTGYQAGFNLQASGTAITNGGNGTSLYGYQAGYNLTTGNGNVATGYQSLYSLTGNGTTSVLSTTANYNTAYGYKAGNGVVSGNSNLFLGYQAGLSATGSGNVFIGANAGANETGDNKLYIANSNTTTPLVLGTFGTSVATSSLQFNGSVTTAGNQIVQGSGGLTVGTSGVNAGKIALYSGTNTVTLQSVGQTGSSYTLNIPNLTANDTICTVGSNNCASNGANTTSSGTVNYVARFTGTNSIGVGLLFDTGTFGGYNITSQLNNSSFGIQAAASSIGLTVKGSGSDIADFVSSGGTTVAKIDASGNFTSPTINATTALQTNGTTRIDASGNFTGGTVNTNTFTSNALTFSGASSTTISAASGQALNLTGNAASTISTSLGVLTLQGGSGVSILSPAGSTSSNITISTGNASSGASGNISLDTGTYFSGSPTISLGTANAAALTLGRSGITTTIQGNAGVTLNATTGTTSVCRNTAGLLSACDATYIAPTAGNFIQNNATTTAQSANFNIISSSTGAIGGSIQGANGQSVALFVVKDFNGTSYLQVGSNGNTSTGNGLIASGSAGVNSAETSSILVRPTGSANGVNIQGTGGSGNLLSLSYGTGATTTPLAKFDTNANFTSYGTSNTYANLATPNTPTLTTGTSGTTYYYAVAAVNAQGTTLPSSGLGTTSNNGVTISWSQVAGATGYKVYRSTTNSFVSGASVTLVATIINGTTLTFSDTAVSGTATTVAAPSGTGLTIQGWNGQTTNVLQTTNASGSTLFSVNAAGLITTSGGLSVTGATAINTSGSATTSIGNSASALTITGNGASSATNVLAVRVAGDTSDRFTLGADGKLSFSGGTSATDTNLYRSAANYLKTDSNFQVAGTILGVVNDAGQITLGASSDTVLSRASGGTLQLTTGGSATATQLRIKGGSSQSSTDLLQIQSSSAVLSGFSGNGQLYQMSNGFKVSLDTTTNSQSAAFTLKVPTNTYYATSTTDTICLQTLGNCSSNGANTTSSGTANYIAKFTGTSTLGNSLLFDNGTYGGYNIGGSQLNSSTFGVTAGSGAIGLSVKGSGSDIVNFINSGNSTVAKIDSTGLLTSNGLFSAYSSNVNNNYNTFIGTNNSNTTATSTTINGLQVGVSSLVNSNPGANVTNAIYLGATPNANNVFNGIYAATGFNSILNYNGTPLISGTGKLQNAALDSTLNYSNLQLVTNLSATGTLNAATGLQTNGTTRIDASGNFTGGTVNTNTLTANALTFSGASSTTISAASGQALNVTGNAASTVSTSAGLLTLQGAAGISLASAAGSTSSDINLKTGNASAGAAGNITLDTGSFTSGTPTISLGATNAAALTLGRSGIITTIQGNTAVTLNATTATGTVCRNTSTGVLSACDATYLAPTATNFIQNNSSATAQTGNFNITGNGIANTLTAGATLSVGSTTAPSGGAAYINGNVGIGTSNIIGQLQVESSTYRSNQLLLNNGVTGTPPTYPNGYLPSISVISSQASGSRPLFFGYSNAGAYSAFLTSGACGNFSQMCLDFGTGTTALTALENQGNVLKVGGGDDGNFSYVNLQGNVGVGNSNSPSLFSVGSSSQFQVSSAGAVTAVGVNSGSGLLQGTGGLTVNGAVNINSTGTGITNLGNSSAGAVAILSGGAITVTAGAASTISTSAGQLTLGSGSGTLGISSTTTTLQRTAASDFTIDLNDSGNRTLILKNSGAGVANLNLFGGSLSTGATPVTRIDNSGNFFSNTETVSPTTDAANVFQVQNAADANVISVNTNATNLAVNGGAENSATFATNWTVLSAGTVTRDVVSGEYLSGTAGVKDVTTTASTSGVQNNLGAALTTATTYLVSFSAKGSAASANNTINVVYYRTSGTADSSTTTCTSNVSPSALSTAWTRYNCYLTTSATAGTTTASLGIYVNDTTARTVYLDNLSITQQTASTLTVNQVQIGGVSGQGLTVLTLDTAATAPTTASNTTALLGSIYYDTTAGAIQCYGSNGWGACGVSPNIGVNLIPEYSGAVLDGTKWGSNKIGTMTSGLCSGTSRLSVNTSLCGATDDYNYYAWTSPQATSQTYSVFVRYQLPATFKSFTSSAYPTLSGYSTNVSSSATGSAQYGGVQFSMFDKNGNTCGATGSNGAGVTSVTGTANSWQTGTLNPGASGNCSFSANDVVTFRIDMTSINNSVAYASNLSFLTIGK